LKHYSAQRKESALKKVIASFDKSQLTIDLTEYKDPVKSPQDSAVELTCITPRAKA